MMAITTSSSTSVNPKDERGRCKAHLPFLAACNHSPQDGIEKTIVPSNKNDGCDLQERQTGDGSRHEERGRAGEQCRQRDCFAFDAKTFRAWCETAGKLTEARKEVKSFLLDPVRPSEQDDCDDLVRALDLNANGTGFSQVQTG
jgi:hypothetical protein